MRTILVSILVMCLCSAPTSRLRGQSAAPLDYVCPMDADVRSDKPGKCPRCGMTLQLGIPDPKEYSLELNAPSNIRPGEPVDLVFTFRDPKNGSVVKSFELVHEKIFHLFVVGEGLQYFLHDHPVAHPDGTFGFRQVFPTSGMYRLLADVYPTGGTPQLLTKTIFVSSAPNDEPALKDVMLKPDRGRQHGANTEAELVTEPQAPIAGQKTHVWFKFNTAEHMEPYLGAWAHLLVASDDTIDLLHQHPVLANGGPEIQFDLIFPRARTYRLWVQFQRNHVVNTVAVTIPVVTLEQAQGVR